MKKFAEEFKTFVMRGNVMDLAVGVLIGAAFQGVVAALTENILNPIVGLFGGSDLSAMLVIPLWGEASIKLGAFLAAVINFVIMAFVVFLMMKAVNRLMRLGRKKAPEPVPTTKKCPYCFTDIPLQATRCPNCTAELAGENVK